MLRVFGVESTSDFSIKVSQIDVIMIIHTWECERFFSYSGIGSELKVHYGKIKWI